MAALSSWHEAHDTAAEAVADVAALPAHAFTEAYAVLTRLPGGRAAPAGTVMDVLTARFGRTLDFPGDHAAVMRQLADAGVFGGSTYDGLVALQAAAHGQVLLTLDRRAAGTYRRVGVPFELLD